MALGRSVAGALMDFDSVSVALARERAANDAARGELGDEESKRRVTNVWGACKGLMLSTEAAVRQMGVLAAIFQKVGRTRALEMLRRKPL
jgi:hypothetical protein